MNKGKAIKRERIKHLLRNLISGELLNFQHNNLITLSRVELSSDLLEATFFITIFGDEREDTVEVLNTKRGYFRKLIAKKLNLRYTPSLKFIKEEATLFLTKEDTKGESLNEYTGESNSGET